MPDSLREAIRTHLDNPAELERLYRENASAFRRAFTEIYPEVADDPAAAFWHARLNYEASPVVHTNRNDIPVIILLSVLSFAVAKLPEMFDNLPQPFGARNWGFIIFPFLMIYIGWKRRLSLKPVLVLVGIVLASVVYMNVLPYDNGQSDTFSLAAIHLPLFMWSLLGYVFISGRFGEHSRRLDFLRYNGGVVVLTGLILIAGMVLTGITLGLFGAIEVPAEDFYLRFVIPLGVVAAPIVGSHVVYTNPQLVGKVSPLIARIFSPLVLITLVLYLGVLVVKEGNLFHDRDFLMIFNMLLIGVMALIFFSVAETFSEGSSRVNVWVLFGLSLVTILVNGIALAAILFRIVEWGITPNRLAVLGGNVLIFANLALVGYRLYQNVREESRSEEVGKAISVFLPYYTLWAIIVTFVFPVMFGFR